MPGFPPRFQLPSAVGECAVFGTWPTAGEPSKMATVRKVAFVRRTCCATILLAGKRMEGYIKAGKQTCYACEKPATTRDTPRPYNVTLVYRHPGLASEREWKAPVPPWTQFRQLQCLLLGGLSDYSAVQSPHRPHRRRSPP